ncbi:MAG TPA: 4,5-DOPA dioxygenase extradiol [Thermomicrobiales bacterium]|nr:4,5-DOPA dioxygenase extradiol [Thermomicrobiales bacterium]
MPTTKMPALFIGHGGPAAAVAGNDYTAAWAAIARRFPRPRAVVVVSAHWECKGVLAIRAERPRTIHDFYHADEALYSITYPCPGAPWLAWKLEEMLTPFRARADLDSWGLDHGAWTVLRWMYPDADVPVVALSQDVRRTAAGHYDIGRHLAPLRDDGILILGSGNVVHNFRAKENDPDGADGARFNEAVKARIAARDHAALIDHGGLGPEAAIAVPEPEHYQPLLYVLATQEPDEDAAVIVDGMPAPGISMLSVAVGL